MDPIELWQPSKADCDLPMCRHFVIGQAGFDKRRKIWEG